MWQRRRLCMLILLIAVVAGLSFYYTDISQTLQETLNEVVYADLTTPPPEITLRNDLWQIEKDNQSETAIFRAFYDDREDVMSVKIIAISSKTGTPPLCMYWANHEPITSFLWAPTELEGGRGYAYKGVQYMEKIYNCPFPIARGFPPTHVSLVHSANTTQISNIIPIIFPQRNQVHSLGACIPLSYGTIDPVRLIEWLELNKMLGVEEFNFYTSRIDPKAMAVLQEYQEQGVVKVVQMSPPFQFDSPNASWCYWCQKITVLAALNDCMYRNMYRYKHLLTLDVDEVIVPKNETQFTLVELLEDLDPVGAYSDYEFRNTYFFFDLKETTAGDYKRHLKKKAAGKMQKSRQKKLSQRHQKLYRTFLKVHTFPHTVITRYLSHVAPSPLQYSSKSIIDPRKCVSLQNHRCMLSVPHKSKKMYVDLTQATNNHFKKCHLSKNECKTMLERVFIDDTMLKYSKKLVSKVIVQYKKLAGQIGA